AHRPADLQREPERLAAALAVDAGGRALLDRLHEGLRLERQGVAGMALLPLLDRALHLADVTQAPGLQVGRHVAPGLEHAELAHRRLADPARGKVRDAAVGEFDARRGDVDFLREDAKAASAQLAHLPAPHPQPPTAPSD